MIKFLRKNLHLFLYLYIVSLIVLIVLLPNIRKSRLAPEDTFYAKVHRAQPDYYSLISFIRQGRTQKVQVNQFTTEESKPSRSHPFYLLLGKIGTMINLSDINMYYLGMYIPLIIFCIYAFLLVQFIIPNKYQIWAILLIFFSSPFPKEEIVFLGKKIPFGIPIWMGLDIYSRLTLKPHHMIATALILATVYYLFKFKQKKSWSYLIISTLHMIVSIYFFAIPGIIVTLTLGVYLFFILLIKLWKRYTPKNYKIYSDYSKTPFFLFGCLFIIFAAAITFYFIARELSQFTTVQDGKILNILTWENQAFVMPQYTFGFKLYIYLISFGLLPILILPGVLYIRQNNKFEYIFILLMSLISFFLYLLTILRIIQIPVVRLVFWAPYFFMGILATLGVIYICEKKEIIKYSKKILFILCVLFFINTIFGLKSYWLPELSQQDFWQYNYIPNKYFDVFSFLNTKTPMYSNIMASYYTGMIIPAYTHNKVFIGHEANTYNFAYKWWFAQEFMAGKLPTNEAKKLLSDYQISFVFWDNGIIPTAYKSFLDPVYKVNDIFIYKFNKSPVSRYQ